MNKLCALDCLFGKGIAMEGICKAKNLQPGDEIERGEQIDTVWNRYNDLEGTWIDWESGDCGYVGPEVKYWVINL